MCSVVVKVLGQVCMTLIPLDDLVPITSIKIFGTCVIAVET